MSPVPMSPSVAFTACTHWLLPLKDSAPATSPVTGVGLPTQLAFAPPPPGAMSCAGETVSSSEYHAIMFGGGAVQAESGGGAEHCTVTVFGESMVMAEPLATLTDPLGETTSRPVATSPDGQEPVTVTGMKMAAVCV